MDATFIESLKNPALYPHPVNRFEVLETHISWVLLTGPYAYKIKKPVNFGFLDFSTLDKRKFCCEEEIRLNQRLAPELYLGLVPIYGSCTHPSFEAKGAPIEYAVKMVQFDQSSLLTNVLERRELTPKIIDELADVIASFYQKIPPADMDTPYGSPEAVLYPVIHNFTSIEPLLTDPKDKTELAKQKTWAIQKHQSLSSLLEKRKSRGYIRECHGDIHLGNIVWSEGKVTLFDSIEFDCIEFNKPYHWIDVISDLAFLMMDLQSRNLPEYANQLLNRYLEQTGDYEALPLLPFYAAYRAMVRAKVSILRLDQPGLGKEEQKNIHKRYCDYVKLAEVYTTPRKGHLIIMQGISGSGKSICSSWLAGKLDAIRLRSDVERKRLFGLTRNANSEKEGLVLYTQETSAKTFKKIADYTTYLCQQDFGVIVDATFLKKADRMSFHTLANKLTIPFHIVECATLKTQAEEWLIERLQNATDPSEATPEVLENQSMSVEPISTEEAPFTITIKEMNEAGWEKALKIVKEGLGCTQSPP